MASRDDVPDAPDRPTSRGRVRLPSHVVHRSFGDQTVLLNLRTGQYHGLNRSGGRMLALLEETGSMTAVASRIAAEHGRSHEEIALDVVEFCAGLEERGLLEIDVAQGA
jgi:hypothetical protein